MDKTDRRDTILHGAMKVLATKGLEGFTHRAVDSEADLPAGSSSYYFSKKISLLIAVSEFLSAKLEEDCDGLQVMFSQVIAEHGLETAKNIFVTEFIDYLGTSQQLFLARIQLTLASTYREELAGVGERLTAAAQRPTMFFLKLFSEDKEEGWIDTCAGLIDGIALMHAISRGEKPTKDQISTAIRLFL